MCKYLHSKFFNQLGIWLHVLQSLLKMFIHSLLGRWFSQLPTLHLSRLYCSVALHRTLSLVSFSLLVCFISACPYSSGRNHNVQNSFFHRCKETQFLHSLLNLARMIHSTMAFTYLQGFYRQDCRQMYRLTGDNVFVCLSSTFLASTKAGLFLRKIA